MLAAHFGLDPLDVLPPPQGRGVLPIDVLQLFRSWLRELPHDGHPGMRVVLMGKVPT